jgi:hypothetical protein
MDRVTLAQKANDQRPKDQGQKKKDKIRPQKGSTVSSTTVLPFWFMQVGSRQVSFAGKYH